MYELQIFGHLVTGDAAPGLVAFTKLRPAMHLGWLLLSDDAVFLVLIRDLDTGDCVMGRRNRYDEVTWCESSLVAAEHRPGFRMT